jgi:hypothetical protein
LVNHRDIALWLFAWNKLDAGEVQVIAAAGTFATKVIPIPAITIPVTAAPAMILKSAS